MSGVPSAFIFVLVEVDEAEVLVAPMGLVVVLDLVVVRAAGVWAVVVILVVFVELVLTVPVTGAGVWACTALPPSKLREMRKPMMRFIVKRVKGEKDGPFTPLRTPQLDSNVPIFCRFSQNRRTCFDRPLNPNRTMHSNRHHPPYYIFFTDEKELVFRSRRFGFA